MNLGALRITVLDLNILARPLHGPGSPRPGLKFY